MLAWTSAGLISRRSSQPRPHCVSRSAGAPASSTSAWIAAKRAIVAGSSKGIGLGVATRLAGEGASVVLNARTADELERAAKELEATGASVTTVAADLTDPTTPARLVDAAMGAFGGVDLVVS